MLFFIGWGLILGSILGVILFLLPDGIESIAELDD